MSETSLMRAILSQKTNEEIKKYEYDFVIENKEFGVGSSVRIIDLKSGVYNSSGKVIEISDYGRSYKIDFGYGLIISFNRYQFKRI